VLGSGLGVGNRLVKVGARALRGRAPLNEIALGGRGVEPDQRRSFLDALAGRRHPGDSKILHEWRIDRHRSIRLNLTSRPDDGDELTRANGREW
jgi:hypothetical protein